MANTKVKLNLAGFRELRTSPEVVADLKRRGEAVAERAGDGYEVLVNSERAKRGGVTVIASSPKAKRREARDHPLLQALGAARG
jgi:hypothetical protein